MALRYPYIQTLSGATPTLASELGQEGQITLSANTSITITSDPGDKGLIYVNNGGTHTLTINGSSVAIRNNGRTVVAWINGPFGYEFDTNYNFGSGGTQLAAPTNLAAIAISSTENRLTWTDADNDFGYSIESSNNGTTGWTQIATTAANATTYTHTVGTAATLKYYRVKSIGNASTYLDSPYSSVVSARTATGANRTATLDSLSGVLGSYSLAKVRTAYSGAAIRVRRSSDNAETDIGFDANGNLNVSAFNTHVGAGQGFVTTWYDQSTNAKHATQTNTALQPELKVLGINARPTIYFAGTQFLTIATSTSHFIPLHDGDATLNVVGMPGVVSNPNLVYSFFGNNGSSSSNTGVWLSFDDRDSQSINNGIQSLVTKSNVGTWVIREFFSGIITPNQYSIITHSYDPTLAASSRSDVYANGGARQSQNVSDQAPVNTAATYDMQIGATGNSNVILTGYINEVNFFSAKLSDTNRNLLRDHQNTYYAIY